MALEGACPLPVSRGPMAMVLALPNPAGSLFELSSEAMAEGLGASRESPRRRIVLPIHRKQDDLVQRLLNFLQPGTYIRPHHHPREHASETLFVIAGAIGFVVFDEKGTIDRAIRLDAGGLIDIEARVWHGVIALAEDTVILEIKRGPYNEEDKVFAEWAPPEGSKGAAGYLTTLSRWFEGGGRERDREPTP